MGDILFLNIFMVTKYIFDDGSCETETHHAVLGLHETGAVELRTAWRSELKTLFTYISSSNNILDRVLLFHVRPVLHDVFRSHKNHRQICILSL
jgi:hypothetical protein